MKDPRTIVVHITFTQFPLNNDQDLGHPESMTFYGGDDTKLLYTDDSVLIFSEFMYQGFQRYPRRSIASLEAKRR